MPPMTGQNPLLVKLNHNTTSWTTSAINSAVWVYNQKGGWTVVVRVVAVLAGRGGAAPSALVSCFRLSAPRNALRDSLRSSFTFGQTCPRMNRTRAASPKAQATEIARRRRRCRGSWGCPCLTTFSPSDMITRCASATCRDEGVPPPGSAPASFKLCVTFTEHPNTKRILS